MSLRYRARGRNKSRAAVMDAECYPFFADINSAGRRPLPDQRQKLRPRVLFLKKLQHC